MIWELVFAIPVCIFLSLLAVGLVGWEGISIDLNINVNHTIRHEDDLDE